MLEPIGLIARLDRLGRARSTRCVYGLSMVPGTSRQAERQFKRECASSEDFVGSARPRGGKGEPAAASRPAWQKASIKGRLEGQRLTQGGQPGVPHIFKGYAHKFTLFASRQ